MRTDLIAAGATLFVCFWLFWFRVWRETSTPKGGAYQQLIGAVSAILIFVLAKYAFSVFR